MNKIKNQDIQIGKEYFCKIRGIKPFSDYLEGIYKVEKIYNETRNLPSPSTDMGNGIQCVLSVAVFKDVSIVVLKNVFTNESRPIDNEEIFIEFFEFTEKERYIESRKYETSELVNKLKDKEFYFKTTDIFSLCIILDIRYSVILDKIYFIIMDCHLRNIESYKEDMISFYNDDLIIYEYKPREE